MRLVLLGDADDGRGFRLAGVETILCRTRDDVEREVATLLQDGGRQIGVVLVSAAVYQLAPHMIDAIRDRPLWPILLVLPGHADAGRKVA